MSLRLLHIAPYHLPQGQFAWPACTPGNYAYHGDASAALCGCQVVACSAGGAPEALLQGRLGYLAEPGNTAALLQAIARALETPLSPQQKAERKKMVEEHFGFGNFTRSMEQLIRKLF